MAFPKSPDKVQQTNITLAQSDIDYLLLWHNTNYGSDDSVKLSAALTSGAREVIERCRKVYPGGRLAGPPTPAPGARTAPGTKFDLKRQIKERDAEILSLRAELALSKGIE
jgi:hypothetical protein